MSPRGMFQKWPAHRSRSASGSRVPGKQARARALALEALESRQLLALVPASQAATGILPGVPGDGVAIEVYNGIGGGTAPLPAHISGWTPTGTTLSPLIDFPRPGSTINVGQSFTLKDRPSGRPGPSATLMCSRSG